MSDTGCWQENKKPEGPPELDQLLKDFQKKVKGWFGQKPKRPGFPSSSGNSGPQGAHTKTTHLWSAMKPFWGLILLILGVGYVLMGIYIVQPAERAVVTRFGRYERTEGPGLHWLPRFIEQEEKVNVERRETSRHQGAMLTEDENIVIVDIAVQYRVKNAKDFLFNVASPIRTLGEATESALRQVIGQSKLDDVLTSGRASIASAIKKQLVDTLESYGTGLEIYDVNMQPAKAPEEVRSAFDDVIKAREEHESLVYGAQAYANDILPKAKGQAERMLQEANGYREEMKLLAEGESKRFNLVLPEYQKAPQVTRSRLYLETLEQVLSNSGKILLDYQTPNALPLLNLPLDKLLSSGVDAKSEVKPNEPSSTSTSYYREEASTSPKPTPRRFSKENSKG